MKKLLVLVIVAGLMVPVAPLAVGAANDCFKVVASQWGKHCDGDPSSLELTVKNTCNDAMSLLYCLEQEGGAWDCQIMQDIKKDAEVTVHSCKNTGNYEFTACLDTYDCQQEKEKKGKYAPGAALGPERFS